VSMGQPSSSVVMGKALMSVMDIRFPGHILGFQRGVGKQQ
jgi:hypothetical protein